MRQLLTAALLCGLVLFLTPAARADWPHDVKWDQLLPQDLYGAASYLGMTVPGEPVDAVAADDFPCTETGWITDIEFSGFGEGALSFRVRFWTDVPASPEEESQPGQLLYDQTFEAAGLDGLGWQLIGDDTYKINIPEPLWFRQEGTATCPAVYWIGIQAVIDPQQVGRSWFWHFRERNEATWGDDAAFASAFHGWEPWGHWGWPTLDPGAGPDLYGGKLPADWAKSADMSFRLTGIPIPEPATCLLVALGAALLAALRRRTKA